MRIDAIQPQALNPAAIPSRQETAGEREPDGDADDMAVRTGRMQPALQSAGTPSTQQSVFAAASTAVPQALPQGMGTKVDLFA